MERMNTRILKLNICFLSISYQLQSNLCRFLLILAISGLNGEKASGSSDVNSSVEDDAVTITNCYLRDSESHSSSSDNDGTGKQCMSAYIRRQSGNITLNDDRFGMKVHLYQSFSYP